MSFFDLLFIVLFLSSAITLLAILWFLVRKQFARAGRVLRRLLICAAAYMAVVIVVSLVLPRRVLRPDETQCFDDWCIGVDASRRVPQGEGAAVSVDIRLSSRAKRISQREKNIAVYLTDYKERRFDPVADSSAAPFDVLLGPQESRVITRSFLVPSDAKDLGLVITHEGGFPIGWFIIGYDTWFRKDPVVRLQN